MKVNELMIGDWVYIKEYPMAKEAKRMTANHFARSLCEFEPIPLTEEILKANGFHTEEFEEYGEVGWYPKEGCTYIMQYSNRNPMFALEETGIELEYVHQVQHALRLCGLNELADTFKV